METNYNKTIIFVIMETIEIWKPIVSYETLYMVSNLGNVKALYFPIGNRKTNVTIEKIISQNIERYVCVTLKGTPKLVHRLVALTFIPNPENKKTVNHKNGIKTDNRVENLEWCTPKENDEHSRSVLGNHTNGEKNGFSKLTNHQVIEIRKEYAKGNTSHRKLGMKYGVWGTTINDILNKKRWKHLVDGDEL